MTAYAAKTTALIIIITISLTCFLSLASVNTVRAQETPTKPTLADTINSIVNNVTWTNSNSWTSLWGTIFSQNNISALDDAINQDIAGGDLLDALLVARLADLNNYSSPVISAQTREALQRMPMTGSLPATSNAQSYGDPGTAAFLVYYRYLVYSYLYAQQQGLMAKWNATQAYLEFKSAYLKPPSGSTSGEMLWVDPAKNWSASYSSRYYDEHAETMDMFLNFAKIGIPEAMNYADDAWQNVQAHWNGQYYGYTGQTTVECEMGNFAEVAAAYMQQKGQAIPFWDRVISNLNYTLLANGWDSPAWAQPGVVVHATSNPQLRLWETTSVIIALQQLFPYFSDQMKANFTNLLMGPQPAWKGLINSPLNVNGTFIPVGGSNPSIDATVDAAATLFLEGIVPVTGNLAIPISNEQYQDCRTPFRITDFKFDFDNHLIKIPVTAGTLTFIYGSTPVSYTFPANGTYTIQFSNDWNTIIVDKNISAPTNLVVKVNDFPQLTWSPPNGVQTTEEYQIYRGTSSGAETLLTETNNTSYIDLDATNGYTYFYRVAINETLQSNEASVTFDYAPLISSDYSDLWHTSDFQVLLSMPQESGNATINYRINSGPIQTVPTDGQPTITSDSADNTLEYWGFSPLRNSRISPYRFDKFKAGYDNANLIYDHKQRRRIHLNLRSYPVHLCKRLNFRCNSNAV